jgi:5-methyltetrahydrofolate--homocysteine methyltransferase
MDILEDIKASIINMDEDKTKELIQKAIGELLEAGKILNEGLIPAMEVVGKEYEEGKKFIPEMLLAAEAMKGALELLRPLLAKAEVKAAGKVVMGTVEGDVHDIGQNLVSTMLEGGGFKVSSLGTDVSVEEFVTAVKEESPDIIGMSALLTTTMPHMKDVVDALIENGLRDKVKVMVGGATLNQQFADEYGADGFAPDASSAVRLAKRLISGE